MAKDYPRSDLPWEPCRNCGVRISKHLRCRACLCLAGPGHTEYRLIQGLCAGCVAHRERLRGWLADGWRTPDGELEALPFYQELLLEVEAA